MMDNISSGYRIGTYLSVIFTYVLILLGGFVKAINAGLACPSWPLCYGKLFPFFNNSINFGEFNTLQVFAEWFHRLWAASLGIWIIYMTFLAFKMRKNYSIFLNLSIILLVLFGVQVIFGDLTVMTALAPFVVVVHLGNAVLIIILEMILAFFATHYSSITKVS